jgi:hypothetical protein
VTQPVSNAADIPAGQARTHVLTLRSEANSSFGDDLQLPLDSRQCLGIGTERIKIRARREFIYQANGFQDVA